MNKKMKNKKYKDLLEKIIIYNKKYQKIYFIFIRNLDLRIFYFNL
jgi:hypothetical protein